MLVLPYGGRRELIRTLIDKNHVWLRQKTWHDSIKAILGYDVHVLRTISNTPKGREYLTWALISLTDTVRSFVLLTY